MDIFPPIHKEGYLFITAFAVISLLAFLIWPFLGWVGVIMTIWCALFFRDPERITPASDNLWIAPADGVVCAVRKSSLPSEISRGNQSPFHQVSIFMNVFNCHINRTPQAGEVEYIDYIHGSFFNASLDKASEKNERQYITMRSQAGDLFVVTQIAGLVARRIVSWTKIDDNLKKGERFGMIRFGSRVDIYLPEHVALDVEIGQTMIGGETVIAHHSQNDRGEAVNKT